MSLNPARIAIALTAAALLGAAASPAFALFGGSKPAAATATKPADPKADAQALKARNILVRNFSGAHPLLANCLRISIGSPDENAALLAALNEILIA